MEFARRIGFQPVIHSGDRLGAYPTEGTGSNVFTRWPVMDVSFPEAGCGVFRRNVCVGLLLIAGLLSGCEASEKPAPPALAPETPKEAAKPVEPDTPAAPSQVGVVMIRTYPIQRSPRRLATSAANLYHSCTNA